ncbi:MAG: hypothetical protein IT304_04025 [Dehalococcoidia bacterium]|nr:hypothetical protein [Dehalococcoidia bacterium]
MEEMTLVCDHRWRYFVDVQARAVRARQCESCGTKERLGRARQLKAPVPAPALAERLSA